MLTLAQKIANARYEAKLTQDELANACDVTKRSIAFYESGEKRPRINTMIKLANALGVSVKYLTDSSCTNPKDGIESNPYIEQVNNEKGSSEAMRAADLLAKNVAFLAGNDVPEEEKEIFMQSMLAAMELCRKEAQRKFTPSKYKENGNIIE